MTSQGRESPKKMSSFLHWEGQEHKVYTPKSKTTVVLSPVLVLFFQKKLTRAGSNRSVCRVDANNWVVPVTSRVIGPDVDAGWAEHASQRQSCPVCRSLTAINSSRSLVSSERCLSLQLLTTSAVIAPRLLHEAQGAELFTHTGIISNKKRNYISRSSSTSEALLYRHIV
ncbi:hypothetical protein RRG08_016184 [Elysia crispata]|uniref:Uncharacterized protein n=1 Tax=Elysia crispata TaxID=231223 RepID=A0AAE0ZPI6_9GAST|nr:hypothetical protein RRG08_016184 [Elysia crispata]